MCIATAAALNKHFQNEPIKICVTPGLAKSELLSEVVMYLVRVRQYKHVSHLPPHRTESIFSIHRLHIYWSMTTIGQSVQIEYMKSTHGHMLNSIPVAHSGPFR